MTRDAQVSSLRVIKATLRRSELCLDPAQLLCRCAFPARCLSSTVVQSGRQLRGQLLMALRRVAGAGTNRLQLGGMRRPLLFCICL